MSNEIKLATFPSNKNEALAMLYMNSIDLSGKTPEEIVRIYAETLNKVEAEFRAIRYERKAERSNV